MFGSALVTLQAEPLSGLDHNAFDLVIGCMGKHSVVTPWPIVRSSYLQLFWVLIHGNLNNANFGSVFFDNLSLFPMPKLTAVLSRYHYEKPFSLQKEIFA